MKHSFLACILASSFMLTGCASMFGPPLTPGMPVQQVIARNGPPAIEYPDGDTKVLEWPVSEWSQYAYMARIGPDGKLISYENVRTREKFATIKVNQFNKNDVLRTIGHPTETEYFPLKKQEAWSYRYKEEGIWNSMMHIYFDSSGIVRGMENGQDPLYLRDNGFFGGPGGMGIGIGIGGGGGGIGIGF
ncbi:hypothetical protein NB636_00185 [Oxalobacter aliiformigenes]|uniref:hypothetical protein n=1 Tax=Oxalobacter aliiformigenes TaxID=2946593 RepID=UPI0022AF6DED|nr:hypothetical protein [Oxalobacter aliiformigenes]MCZ4065055.1 hypothetical protein [Oxalobacter aliiformigenes]WAV99319.1 hypothetical protein NB636_00185 [Oxalobacter aliiformigenes]